MTGDGSIPASVLGGREDRDGDGVGDLCDPEPDNCLALFDSFACSVESDLQGSTLAVATVTAGGSTPLPATDVAAKRIHETTPR